MSVSRALAMFMREAPARAGAWLRAAKSLDAAGALGKKTAELAYVAGIAAAAIIVGAVPVVLEA